MNCWSATKDLIAYLETVLFRHDPIGINFGENTDEYRSEAETIAIRLAEATGENDVLRIVHKEFVRWFDASVAGPVERYADVAHEAWVHQQARYGKYIFICRGSRELIRPHMPPRWASIRHHGFRV